MDASSGDRSSPRSRQLQGPRPPRLAVSKDSHKVRKPPIAPQRHHHLQQQQQVVVQHHQHQYPQQARQPVIIYDASPKVIHTKPGDFMALVQRLTGPGSTSQAQFDAAASGSGAGAGPSSDALSSQATMEFEPREFMLSPTAALSPAARLAAIERSVRPLPPHAHPAAAHAPPAYYYGGAGAGADDDFFLSASASADLDSFAAALGGGLPSARPGILSPAALPPAASTGLFSPMPFDPSCLSWLSGELMSPFLHSAGTRAEQQAPFAPSPRSNLLLATPTMPSPATFSVLEFFSSSGGGFPDM